MIPSASILSVSKFFDHVMDIADQNPKRIHVTYQFFPFNEVLISNGDILHRIEHSHLSVIFATSEHIPLLLKFAPSVPMLRLVISIDDLSLESKRILTSWGETQKVRIMELRERAYFDGRVYRNLIYFRIVEAIGRLNPIEPIPATPEQVASICYTSVRMTSLRAGYLLKHLE